VTLFLEHGAKVASFDIATPAASGNASELAVKCNVASESDVNDAVSKVLAHWGAVDILVNCAGVVDEYGNVYPPPPRKLRCYTFH
jgi:NAD(P)-dependent dehydrogenase (short-subunit alcohol dehydrogenase family)